MTLDRARDPGGASTCRCGRGCDRAAIQVGCGTYRCSSLSHNTTTARMHTTRGCKGVKVVAPLASDDILRLVVNGDIPPGLLVVGETIVSSSYLFSFQRKGMPRGRRSPLTYTQPSRKGSKIGWDLVPLPLPAYAGCC